MIASRQVLLKEVAEIERCGVQPEKIETGSIYVGLEHIAPGGAFLDPRAVATGDLASTKFRFSDRHVLYGKLRPYLNKIACPDFSGVCSTDILPILSGPEIDRRYLFHFLRQPRMIEYASSRAVGINLPRLSPSQLEEFRLPLPQLPEQRRIATVLDRAEALRAKRRAALAQLDTLAQSIFLDMFAAAVEFDLKQLDEVCELITDGTHYTPTYAERGVVFLSSRNVTSGAIDWENVKYIPESLHVELHRRVAPQKNDILLAKNGTTGVAALVDRECIFDIYVSLALLRPSGRVLPIYLRQAVNSPECTRQFNASLKGIGVPNLHLKDIRKTKIPVPPIKLQQEFVTRIEKVESLREAQEASLVSLNWLFASLQHRAFRGEL